MHSVKVIEAITRIEDIERLLMLIDALFIVHIRTRSYARVVITFRTRVFC